MRLKIRSGEDFYAGLMFVIVGVVTFVMAYKYSMGSAGRMGPGYFPRGIGAIMTFLGVVITVRALAVDGDKVGGIGFRPLFLLCAAMAGYGFLMDRIGFIPALAVLVLFSSLAGKEFNAREVAILMVSLIVGAWALFIKALELPFRLFWWDF